MFAALHGMDVLLRLISITLMLSTDLRIDVCYASAVVATIDLCSDIHQGCPLSGIAFALALDPFVRWYLCRPASQAIHIFV